MNRRFSIGEVSKLHHVSVQALRHYDKIGLLKPAYIDEKSKYRYYSIEDFIMLDFIKQCKAMGLTLDEIKGLVENYTSISSILEIITKQKEMISLKIKELENIRNNIEVLEYKIQTAVDEGIGKVFIKQCEKRNFIKYNNTKRYTAEFEIKLSEKLSAIEKKYGTVYRELAFAVPYDKFKMQHELIYDHMMLGCYDTLMDDEEENVILPAGQYVTIHFDDDYKDTSPYYEKLLAYIKAHQLQVASCFYESYILTRMGQDDEGKSLGQIQIQLKTL